jgi:hypothetical protein
MNMVPTENTGGYFPLTAIRSMLFRDDTLENITPQSKSSGDTAKVVIIPRGIGMYLAGLDPTEEIFHIETFESHSEVWLKFEWSESNARRSKLKDFLFKEREARQKHASRIERIKALLPPQGGESWNTHLANLALAEYKNGQMDKVLTVLNIKSVLEEFEEEDKHEQQNKKE